MQAPRAGETPFLHRHDGRVGAVTSPLRLGDGGIRTRVGFVVFAMDTQRELPSRSRSLRSSPTRLALALLAVLALLAAACGGDDDSNDAGSGDSTSDAERDFVDGGTDDGGDSGPASPTDFDGDMSDDAEAGFFDPSDDPDPSRLEGNEFRDYGIRPFVDADDDNRSTFALDVDTGAYTVTRRWLQEGVVPDPASVRVEEFVNAFDYDYRPPGDGLSLEIDGAPSPFDEDNVLVRIGVQAAVVDDDDRADAALTFVVDTSGSMDRDDRLGLVKESLEELVRELRDDDTVAIVVYGDDSTVVLEPTPVRDDDEIYDAIDDLRPGGSTNMEAGLASGYRLAEQAFVEDGINRVILASDGVANVGMTDPDGLTREITDRAIGGIQLVTVGFGMGNFNDTLMEQLADQGDGFYAYVDTRDEAEELFENELVDTLTPIARDAKIQVEFDTDVVDEYRLIGFENRGVLDDDFRDDDVDAGELNSGHTVTAIYEIDLRGGVDGRDDIGEVTLRWFPAEGGDAVEIDERIEIRDLEDDWRDTDADLRLATVVTVWAELLRNSPYADDLNFDLVATEAERLDDELDTEQTRELAMLTERSAALS